MQEFFLINYGYIEKFNIFVTWNKPPLNEFSPIYRPRIKVDNLMRSNPTEHVRSNG